MTILLKRYLLLESAITGEIILHGIFVTVGPAMRIINKHKHKRETFVMQEVWIKKEKDVK